MNELDYLKQEVHRLSEENMELVTANYELIEIIQAKNAVIEKLEEENNKYLNCVMSMTKDRNELVDKVKVVQLTLDSGKRINQEIIKKSSNRR
jgi:hypothetical protein